MNLLPPNAEPLFQPLNLTEMLAEQWMKIEDMGSVSDVFLRPSGLRSASFNKSDDELETARRIS